MITNSCIKNVHSSYKSKEYFASPKDLDCFWNNILYIIIPKVLLKQANALDLKNPMEIKKLFLRLSVSTMPQISRYGSIKLHIPCEYVKSQIPIELYI